MSGPQKAYVGTGAFARPAKRSEASATTASGRRLQLSS